MRSRRHPNPPEVRTESRGKEAGQAWGVSSSEPMASRGLWRRAGRAPPERELSAACLGASVDERKIDAELAGRSAPLDSQLLEVCRLPSGA